MVHIKMIDEQVVLRIKDIGRFHVPNSVIEDDMRRLYTDMSLRFLRKIAIKSRDGVQLATHMVCRIAAIPTDTGIEIVVYGLSQDAEI